MISEDLILHISKITDAAYEGLQFCHGFEGLCDPIECPQMCIFQHKLDVSTALVWELCRSLYIYSDMLHSKMVVRNDMRIMHLGGLGVESDIRRMVGKYSLDDELDFLDELSEPFNGYLMRSSFAVNALALHKDTNENAFRIVQSIRELLSDLFAYIVRAKIKIVELEARS